jgi:tripartite-type tricarboxylate transporter receptor subunit TctC
MRSRIRALGTSLLLALAVGAAPAFGQAPSKAAGYPSRLVKVVVPFPPGGMIDLVARATVQQLSEQLGQTFVVENKVGASGVLGSDFVAKSTADGYTLLVNASILIINPLFLPNVPYDPKRDFTPISQIGEVPLLATVHPSVPASSFSEFIAFAKANPGKLTSGTVLGAAGHLANELIKRQASVDIMVVPYKGMGPAINDHIGGHISAMVEGMATALPHVKAGRLKPLAVTTKTRNALLPDVPTASESGLPGFEISSWYGLWGPAGLPEEVTSRLAAAVVKAVKAPAVGERLSAQGFVPLGTAPKEFAAYVDEEIARYVRIVKDAKIKAD